MHHSRTSGTRATTTTTAFALALVLASAAVPAGVRAADRFLAWAPTPPMGWNSWDAFGTTITEAQVKAQADFMAEHLLPHGWRILTVDIQWYEPGASGHSYRPDAPLAMDEWGRLVPASNRFPSAEGGAGFKPLADYVHGRGLQFGIHLMRGIPRLAVARNLPVKGTLVRAAAIANVASVCSWNPDMYGVDMARPGAQAYYDSVFELIASWGVDFVKVDDISRPYHEHEAEIEAIRRAIDHTGRPMVLSLSPGETALSAAGHVKRHANLWRISDDFWDTWPALLEQFGRLARWNVHRGPGHWPDADMLPLGVLDLGRRQTRFTPDEQRTLMTLWSIARSPLIHGGDMTKTDAATLALLTNDEVIAVDQRSEDNRPRFDRDGLVAWTARVPGSSDQYLALFNTRDRYPLGAPAADAAGMPIPVTLDEIGILSPSRVRDLWSGRDLGRVDREIAPVVAWHGAVLYRLSPIAPNE
jgi:alpha-galactosidase